VVDSDVDEETEAVADEALVEEAARTRRKNGVSHKLTLLLKPILNVIM
jgi:hypothetical protein